LDSSKILRSAAHLARRDDTLVEERGKWWKVVEATRGNGRER